MSVKLPWDLDTEKAVLGCAFDDQESCAIVCQLQPEDFFEQRHRTILGAIQKVASTGAFVDELSVSNELKRQDKDYAVGGMTYLVGLHSEITTTIYLRQWIRDLRQLTIIRKVAEAANKIANEAHGKRSASELCDFALKEMMTATHQKETSEPEHMGDILRDFFSDLEARAAGTAKARPRYSSGFRDLDRVLLPVEGKQLVLIAGRPSGGKTSFVLHFAERIARAGGGVLFFSLETTKQKIASRALAQVGNVSLPHVVSGMVNQSIMDSVVKAAESLHGLPFWVDDGYDLTLPRLQAKCRRHAARHKLGAVVIDYLQLLDAAIRGESREREVAEISRGLKKLAKEFDVPVIALSQLNRDSDKSGETSTAQLRNSGQLEQDADAIILLRMLEDRGDTRVIEVKVGKQKDGPTGTIRMGFDGRSTRFFDLDEEPAPRRNVPTTRDPREPTDYDF